MVGSGLLDLAAGIPHLASSLTASAIASIQNSMAESGHRASTDQVEFLRTAIFGGIAEELIKRVECRLEGEPQGHVASGSHTASGNKSIRRA